MLCYFSAKSIFSFHFVLFVQLVFVSHTVALENFTEIDTQRHVTPILPLDGALFKRESSGNISQTNVSESYASLEPANNRTNHSHNGEWSSTKSLPPWIAAMKSGALERTGFVALGFMLIILVFFVVRTIRLRRKKSKSRKYGIITSTDMEMEPLDNDDDDEDTTLFDAQHKYSLQ